MKTKFRDPLEEATKSDQVSITGSPQQVERAREILRVSSGVSFPHFRDCSRPSVWSWSVSRFHGSLRLLLQCRRCCRRWVIQIVSTIFFDLFLMLICFEIITNFLLIGDGSRYSDLFHVVGVSSSSRERRSSYAGLQFTSDNFILRVNILPVLFLHLFCCTYFLLILRNYLILSEY